jgi:zinc D-Ala-D-Ala carboxypeptidase
MSAIGRYFTLNDVTKSQTASRLGLANTPTESQLMAIAYVIEHVVDKVKDKFAVDISSFFRNEKLNKAVGGSESSQHCKGEAVDLDSQGNKLNLDVFNFIKDNLVFDQLILEYPEADGTPSWVHVSVVEHPKKNRGQILVKLKDKYIPFGEWRKGMI